ncbi:hypothetical protein BCON_0051g00080 [Botryotinia convoluta]|uniref:Uncharacterized protein n=1 Tax=Botryotinia convoluta TaxID=54673 RepID=A0A4Z1IAX8_9HELO|nr:hypothetical protein BCON_0051g00080 [Botryotinia convoluta]
MDAKLNITSISQISSAIVEASTVENNETTSTPQESSTITTTAMENEDQSATTSLQPPVPSTSTTMSNITPMTSAATLIPPPARLDSKLPLELRLPIYNSVLCMTVAGRLPPILPALHGTSDYSILQDQYRIINFVLSDATLPVFSTITNRGNKLNKILYLHIRSDNFTFLRLNENSRRTLIRHVCKLRNSFQKITFTAIQPTRTPHTTDSELFEANGNVDSILHQICDMVIASDQAPEFRLKFLGYNIGNLIDQRRLNGFVGIVSRRLAVPGRSWIPRRELVGDDGVVHDGMVWIWELV